MSNLKYEAFCRDMAEAIVFARKRTAAQYETDTADMRAKAAKGDRFCQLFLSILDRYSGHVTR